MEQAAAEWRMQGGYFNYRQQQIFFRTEGCGAPLLLLHGFPTSSLDWHKMWDALKRKYTLIALDYIGYGFSSKPGNYIYSIKDNAEIVETLLANLSIDNYHLLAHDVGDSVAQELLARQQDKKKRQIQS